VFLKLVVHPAFTLLFALWLLPDDPVSIKGAVLQAAMPVGVLVAVVSDVYRVDPPRASASVILSTILSVFTLGLLLSL
jgi:predicted permease